MISQTIKQLAAAKIKVASLEAKIATGLRSELSGLPGRYGFDSTAAFIKAVRGAAGRGPQRGPTAAGKRRKRAVITDATRAQVKKLVAAGKTGIEIAKTVGISLPSVQNIKKALGLVESRK